MKQVIKLYEKLCDHYNDKNLQRFCSLQAFLQYKYDNEPNFVKKALLRDVINYAENDF